MVIEMTKEKDKYKEKIREEDLFNMQNKSQFVCFELNSQEFGLKVENVVEVIPVPEVTSVVHTPEFIRGVINLRGEIIVIIDLKIFFSLPKTDITEKSKIVVTQFDYKTIGLIVDSVSQIELLEEVTGDSIPATISGRIAEFLRGVAIKDGMPLMILNLNSILSCEEFKEFEQ
ncbi:chemotaxis protein CheW [Candidatus Dependentiae bacterium]|nr:chemotaxis protein CheW [Candidatus Dependentiae bacterium]